MHGIAVVIPAGLAARLFAPADRRRLAALGDVAWNPRDRQLDGDETAALLAGRRVALGSWGTPHPGTPGLLARCPDLRLWQHVAGSTRHFFGPWLEGRDLVIASCKGAIADAVAEHALAALIVGLRRIDENAAANRDGPAGPPARLRTLAGSSIGVVGASEVGRRVITLLRAMRAEVRCYDPYCDAATLAALGARQVTDLVELCRGSDAVTLHVPALPATEGMIGARELAAMPDGALLVNTARGECVDQAALVRELERGRLRAWLDVTVPEPLPADHALRRLPNVVLTSHIAGPPTALLGRQAVDDVAAFLSGGSPACVMTADQLERSA